ncbi:MAG: phosphate ABC transporter substrate-binding protein [Gammaproteobacteria bacterium]|nr:phosphate ABC transporter substrate-binding protein [Gammaproteobacteria bacterium]
MSLAAVAHAEVKNLSNLTWAGCGISKKAFMAEIAAAYEKKTGIKIELKGGGATRGIRQVATGEVTIGGSCRNLIHQDLKMSPIVEERGVRMNPVAWDALAVLVHKDNPIDNITLDQLRRLYRGEIKSWIELGGSDGPVELYVRKGKISGVGRTLRELVFNDFDAEFVATHVVASSGPLEKGIEKNPAGIGISGISSARRRDVKVLKVEGIEPSYDRIKDGSYAMYRPLYLVTPMVAKPNPVIRDFLNFVLSEEGKQIIRDAGTVPFEDAITTWLKLLNKKKVAVGK